MYGMQLAQLLWRWVEAKLFQYLRFFRLIDRYQITYRIQVQPQNDPYIFNAEQALIAVGETAVPGRFLVDIIPWSTFPPHSVPFIRPTPA